MKAPTFEPLHLHALLAALKSPEHSPGCPYNSASMLLAVRAIAFWVTGPAQGHTGASPPWWPPQALTAPQPWAGRLHTCLDNAPGGPLCADSQPHLLGAEHQSGHLESVHIHETTQPLAHTHQTQPTLRPAEQSWGPWKHASSFLCGASPRASCLERPSAFCGPSDHSVVLIWGITE